jgi:hypothetical protein
MLIFVCPLCVGCLTKEMGSLIKHKLQLKKFYNLLDDLSWGVIKDYDHP